MEVDPVRLGDVMTTNTRAFLSGTSVMVPARWRKHPNWQNCMDEDADFPQQNRRHALCSGNKR